MLTTYKNHESLQLFKKSKIFAVLPMDIISLVLTPPIISWYIGAKSTQLEQNYGTKMDINYEKIWILNVFQCGANWKRREGEEDILQKSF